MTKQRQPGRQKHRPQRTCVICRQRSDKRSLTRLVSTGTGVYIDPTGKQNGRGAYLCDKRECWESASADDTLNRALRTVLSAEDRERIRAAMPED